MGFGEGWGVGEGRGVGDGRGVGVGCGWTLGPMKTECITQVGVEIGAWVSWGWGWRWGLGFGQGLDGGGALAWWRSSVSRRCKRGWVDGSARWEWR